MPDELILDVFKARPFNLVSLTDSINRVPNMYGRLNALNLFPFKPVNTTVVGVEFKDGQLNLIPTSQRGGPGVKNTRGNRKLKFFEVPHIAPEDQIKADDVSKLRAFGTGNQIEPFMDYVNGVLAEMADKVRITLEFLRNGALNGKILDADGSVILDIFAEFGDTEKVVDFALDNANTDVKAKVLEVKRHIEGQLKGDQMTEIRALCDANFFDALIKHPSVVDAYNAQEGLALLQKDQRKGFVLQEVVFEEYAGEATDINGNVHKFIPANTCRFAPMGTTATFRTYLAPADFIEAVGTLGKELYAKIVYSDPANRWVDLLVQSNPLPLCLRPLVLVKGTK